MVEIGSIEKDGEWITQYRGIKSIFIPYGVTSIGKYAFSDCTSLESITVTDKNTAYASQDEILYNKDKRI